MKAKRPSAPPPGEVAIFERLLRHGKENMSPDLARYLLGLEFGEDDRARMHELAVRNQEGALSSEEWDELQGYARAGCLLGVLHVRARQALRRSGKDKAL